MFNKSSNLYGGEWLALVFANRNQSYGAYQLRRQSSSTLLKALFITAPLFVAAFVGPSVVAALKPDEVIADTVIPIDLGEVIHQIKPIEQKPAEAKAQEEVAQKAIAAPKVKSVGMPDNIKVVKDELVTVQPATTDELKDAIIASTTQVGALSKAGNASSGTGTEGLVVGGTASGNGNEILNAASVEHNPEFPGGMDAWAKYIQKNLRYPSMAQEEGIQGKVFLSFVVEKDGTITDVKVTRGIGYGCDDEAMRVIKKSPRWKAGMQNNLPVRVRYNMPINYTMQN